MHISNISKILLEPTFFTNRFSPRMYKIEYTRHDRARERWRALWKALDELIQELLSRDLELERIPALLYKRIDKREREHAHVGIPMIDESCGSHCCFTRGVCLLGVDVVSQFEV